LGVGQLAGDVSRRVGYHASIILGGNLRNLETQP
jgi:hypothetical protein